MPLGQGLPLFSEVAVPRPLKLISSKVFSGGAVGANQSTGVKRVALDHLADIRAIQCCKVENYLIRAKARPRLEPASTGGLLRQAGVEIPPFTNAIYVFALP